MIWYFHLLSGPIFFFLFHTLPLSSKNRALPFHLGRLPSSVLITSTVLIKGTGAHETVFETWAETQKDQWPVELKLLMALPYGSCIWVLCELPGATRTRGLPKTSCLPLLLLKALPSSLLKSPFWLNQPVSISTSYEQRTWNDTQSLPVFPKARRQRLFWWRSIKY